MEVIMRLQLNQGSFVLLYFRLFTFLICIEFVYLYFHVLFCLSVSVKWLAVKTASEMTYIVSCGALTVKLYSNQPTKRVQQRSSNNIRQCSNAFEARRRFSRRIRAEVERFRKFGGQVYENYSVYTLTMRCWILPNFTDFYKYLKIKEFYWILNAQVCWILNVLVTAECFCDCEEEWL